jgi:membrane protein
MLGFGFALAKVFDLHRELEPVLFGALEPIGDRADEITQNIIAFADNIHGGVLSILSFALLLVTVMNMAQKVESSFNYVWRVDRPRSFARRFSEYLSVTLIGPLIIIIVVALIASLSSVALVEKLRTIQPFGAFIAHIGDVLPFLLTVAVFVFLYMFIPNTRVRFMPALLGGLAAGVTWVASGYLFTNLVVSSARLQSIYSGFAIVLILMFWLYLSWLILLLGSQLAFYLQHPFHLRFGQRTEPLDNDARERLCLSVMCLIAADYARPNHGWTQESLASMLRVPRSALDPVMAALRDWGLIVSSADERLIPGRDPHHIQLTDILDSVRGRGREWSQTRHSWYESIDAIADRIDRAIEAELGGKTLGQLIDENLAAKPD